MLDKKIAVIFAVLTLFVVAGGVFLVSKNSSPATLGTSQGTSQSNEAKLFVNEKTHNWGRIEYGGGNVEKTFTIKNTGSSVLKLYNIKTSCMCTTAKLTINGIDSPSFAMHESSSWVGEVASNKEAVLTVVFDPAFHGPTGVGQVTRQVLVKTNDKANPSLEFNLTGLVVK